LAVVEAGLVLAGLEALLDAPAGARYFDQDGERDRAGRAAQVEGQFGWPRDRPADEQRDLRPLVAISAQS
jgi:hypothetical protein